VEVVPVFEKTSDDNAVEIRRSIFPDLHRSSGYCPGIVRISSGYCEDNAVKWQSCPVSARSKIKSG